VGGDACARYSNALTVPNDHALVEFDRAKTHAERMASRDGYFAPESVIRRVGDSPLVPLLGGGPATLLQVAHPLVAAGVAYHSDYRHDLWRRLVRTLRALYLIVYGSKQEAERAGAAVQAVHAHVRGVTREALGPFPAGTPYAASDPDLMLWVHASLVETSLAIQRRFVGRLRPDEEETYYREMALVGRLFGLPASAMPPTLADFRARVHVQLAGPEICVTSPAREIAAVVLDAPLPAPLRLLAPAHRLATAALIPARLREEYGLRWSRARAAALALAARSLRVLAAPLFRAAVRVSPPEPGPSPRVPRCPVRTPAVTARLVRRGWRRQAGSANRDLSLKDTRPELLPEMVETRER
jgi:uncharacterized protein (DUF2236 family)